MAIFDFSIARTKHLAWKNRLRGFLHGQETLTDGQAISHEECDLGKWLYTVGLKKYGAIPEMKLLESEHIELHATVRRIISLKNAGNTSAAEQELDSLDRISRQVVSLLTAVERKSQASGLRAE